MFISLLQVSKFDFPVNEMRKRYKQIAGFFFISSFTGQVGTSSSRVPVVPGKTLFEIAQTVNLEVFARILFLQTALKDTFVTLSILDKGMIYMISKRQSDFGILWGFYFHEISHMRSFMKIKPS